MIINVLCVIPQLTHSNTLVRVICKPLTEDAVTRRQYYGNVIALQHDICVSLTVYKNVNALERTQRTKIIKEKVSKDRYCFCICFLNMFSV